MVDLNSASWNQIANWLRQLDLIQLGQQKRVFVEVRTSQVRLCVENRSSQAAGPTKHIPLPSGSRTMKSRPPHACFLSFWSNIAPAVTYSA